VSPKAVAPPKQQTEAPAVVVNPTPEPPQPQTQQGPPPPIDDADKVPKEAAASSSNVDEAQQKRVEDLTRDNLELVEAIKEYQETLELIMTKHRVLMVLYSVSPVPGQERRD